MSLPTTRPDRYSLQQRLVLAFGILLILFLSLTGLVLNQAYQDSVEAAVEERLQLQIYALLGVAEPEIDGSFFVPDLEESRFNQLDSGLYAFILDEQSYEAWRSQSALNINMNELDLQLLNIEPGLTNFGSLETSTQGLMSFAAYGTYWSNLGRQFSFIVLESVAPSEAEIREFQSNLWIWLGALAVFLSLAQLLLLRWGMKPLKLLAYELAEIENGWKEQLGENYPSELQNLSENMNLLIKTERQRQSRYRVTLGDLAHSLKTPLAVISGIVQQKKRVSKEDLVDIADQVERMNQIVTYQLNRAVSSHQKRVLATSVPLMPVVEKLSAALNKVYLDKGVNITLELVDGVRFYGEESDLTELLGNLLDNAYKYSLGRVCLSALEENRTLVICVEDDGAGIPEKDRHWILERGARADTRHSGQGIGLAVALDIISSYGGELKIEHSSLGGALIQVKLSRA
jgi:two-component system sensor histidine kinase PhoQ